MGERPIIFSAPMVRAILAGRKTQTRRVLKPLKGTTTADMEWSDNPSGIGQIGRLPLDKMRPPRFAVGDLLWVRESWRTELRNDDITPRDLRRGVPIYYEAGGGGEETIPECAGRLRPSIHMPRWASRITLKVTGVAVERLNDISEEDAKAEGVYWSDQFEGWTSGAGADESCDFHTRLPERSFEKLWERINGPGSWKANPWVAAISFERVPSSPTGEER